MGVTSTGVKIMLATISEATLTATIMLAATEIKGNNKRQRHFQIEDKLDGEIENIRELMMNVSQKQQIAASKQKDFRKGKTRRDCESIAGGNLQNTIWRLGEVQLKDDAANGK